MKPIVRAHLGMFFRGIWISLGINIVSALAVHFLLRDITIRGRVAFAIITATIAAGLAGEKCGKESSNRYALSKARWKAGGVGKEPELKDIPTVGAHMATFFTGLAVSVGVVLVACLVGYLTMPDVKGADAGVPLLLVVVVAPGFGGVVCGWDTSCRFAKAVAKWEEDGKSEERT